jgi:hypothetical protein
MAEAATPEAGATKPERTSREAAMERIGRSRVEEINADLDKDEQIEVTALNEDDDPDEAVAEKERMRLEREAAKVEAGERKGGDIYDFLDEPDLAKTKVRVRVDGREEEVVLADALKDVQKLRAASKRLEEASIAKKEAEELRAAAEVDAAEIRRKATEEVAGKKETPSEKAGFHDAVNLMYEGDQEKGAEAFREAVRDEMRRGQSGATVDVADIARKVREQVAWDQAIGQFSVDHKDIVSDRRSLALWQEDLNEAAKESATPTEAIGKATERFLAWRNGAGHPGGAKVTTDDDALARRAAAKRQGAERAVRSSTSLAAGAASHEPKALSVSDVITEMKKLRGQTN